MPDEKGIYQIDLYVQANGIRSHNERFVQECDSQVAAYVFGKLQAEKKSLVPEQYELIVERLEPTPVQKSAEGESE